MIRGKQARYVLVLGAETLTRYVDYKDRATCVIFGDGAGAAIVGPVDDERGILATKICSDGDSPSSYLRQAEVLDWEPLLKHLVQACIFSRCAATNFLK